MKLKKKLSAFIAAAMLLTLIPTYIPMTAAVSLPVSDGYTRYECESGFLYNCNRETNRWGDASGGSWVFGLKTSVPGMGTGSWGNLAYDFGNVSHVEITVNRAVRGVVTLKVGYMTQGTVNGPGGKLFAVKANEEGTARRMNVDNTWESNNMWVPVTNTNGYWMGLAETQVVLEAGENTIFISGTLEGNFINLDYLDVEDATNTDPALIEEIEPAKTPIEPGGNPFVTAIYTADPSAHVWKDGRLYVYPSHDMETPNPHYINCDKMDRYHVYSTDNMVDWRDEGEIWRREQVGWDDTPVEVDLDSNNSGLPNTFMWAPDCAYRNGKYYFYYPYPLNLAQEKEASLYDGDYWNTTWVIGVLVSDFPNKGFESIGYIKNEDGTPWRHGRPSSTPIYLRTTTEGFIFSTAAADAHGTRN